MFMKARYLTFIVVLALLFVLVCPQNLVRPTDNLEEIEIAERNSALTFLRDVIGIDIEAYNVSYKFVTDRNARPEFKVFPRHTTDHVLLLLKEKEGDGIIEILVEFVDGMLEWYWVPKCQGKPKMKFQYSSDIINDVRAFLERYEDVFNASYCKIILPFLEEINVLENLTVEKNNLVFGVYVDTEDNYVSFSWMYTVNGLRSPSIFSFGIDATNNLPLHFYDGWNLWKIGSSEIRVSRDEAINIALKVAESYINSLGAKIVGVTATLDLYNSETTERGGGDRFILFPRWSIELHFDKTYRQNGGKITGYDVFIWADTGEVFWHCPAIFYSGIPESIQNTAEKPVDIWTITALIIATLVIGLLAAPIIVEKQVENRKFALLKWH